MKIFLRIFIICLIALNVNAQTQNMSDDLWTKSPNLKSALTDVLQRESIPTQFELYILNLPLLKEKLRDAPQRGDNFEKSDIIISFPNNRGRLENYQIMEASVMEPELQAKYPEIRSYIGKGIDNPGTIVRFSISPSGLNCLLLSVSESPLLIDPYKKDRLSYIVYLQKDLPTLGIPWGNDIKEPVSDKYADIIKSTGTISLGATDGKLRTFRLALAATGEYSQKVLTTQGIPISAADEVKKATILSELNSLMTRVNALFERDICITMKLVAKSSDIVFLDGSKDLYTDVNNMNDLYINANANEIVCDQFIGSGNYDIGHVLVPWQAGGGVAMLGEVCAYHKAYGISSSVRYSVTMHEIGHQFGAGHTFNSCDINSPKTAVEPGCGQTLMSYGQRTDEYLYFHSVSIDEIWANITAGKSLCAIQTTTGNTVPTVTAGADHTIPKSTPFKLEGTGNDNLGGLTYSWEQTDNEIAAYPPVSVAIGGPLFNCFPPSSSPIRYIPELTTIISGSLISDRETVPSVSRKINFNFIVRDNDARGGQTAIDDKVITVDGNSGPFIVTSQKTPEIWDAGSTQTLSWDVAGTNGGAINAQNVDILFSTDGGYTYPAILASNVPNDGSQNIVVPFGYKTTTGRYMIKAEGNIFFAINSANLTVQESPFLMNFNNTELDICLPSSSAIYDFTYNSYLGFTGTTTFSAKAPNGTAVNFNPTSANANGVLVRMTISGITISQHGKNSIAINAASSGNLKTANVILNVFNPVVGALSLVSPANGAINIAPPFKLTWSADNNAKEYEIEIASDIAFTNIVETATLTTNTYNPATLKINSAYYWRVKAKNPCGEGNFTSAFSFKSLDLSFYTHIPDANFQKFLRNSGIDQGNVDDYVLTESIRNIDALRISGNNISDLTGIQDFTALLYLICSDNKLTNLDVSKNTKLLSIKCERNKLTSINLIQNKELMELNCRDNMIKSLDLSANPYLNYLNCYSNALTSLYLTNNIDLNYLYCGVNQLTSLNVSKNVNLTSLDCSSNKITSIDISGCVSLNTLFCGENEIESLDVTKNIAITMLYCYQNQISTIDLTKNAALLWLNIELNKLTSIDISKNTILTMLNCSSNKLSNLDVSANTGLTSLICYDNQLTNIDVSKNTNLASFWCHRNKLTNLNVSKNLTIKDLSCNSNQITSLDLSLNKSLTKVFCFENKLRNLNLKNGENQNISLLMAKDNPDLVCIQVDNAIVASGYKDWQKNAGASYSENCSLFLSVPDVENSYSIFNQCNIFPNPVSDILNIELFITKKAFLDITIKNMLGIEKTKKSMGEYAQGASKVQLYTSDLQNGVYILELNLTNDITKSKKSYKVIINR